MSRAVLIGSTPVGQYAFLADNDQPGWEQTLAAVVWGVPTRAEWAVIPIPDGHGPRKAVTA